MGYGVIGPREIWIDAVMEHVSKANDLEFGKDVRLISEGSSSDFMNYLK